MSVSDTTLDPNFVEKANEVTNKLATWLHDLIDDAEAGVGVAVEKLAPLATELQRLFSDQSNPLPEGAGEPPAAR